MLNLNGSQIVLPEFFFLVGNHHASPPIWNGPDLPTIIYLTFVVPAQINLNGFQRNHTIENESFYGVFILIFS